MKYVTRRCRKFCYVGWKTEGSLNTEVTGKAFSMRTVVVNETRDAEFRNAVRRSGAPS
jgi:hypothetical protein